MSEAKASPIAAFLATKTGLSTAVITGALSVAVPVVTAAVMHQIAYTKGWEAYETKLRDGTAELDGKRVEVLDADDRQALEDANYLRGQMDGFNDAQKQFIATLEGINANHARAIGAIGARPYTPVERDWRNTDVPDPTRLRLNRIIAARGTHSDRSGLSETHAGSALARYRTRDANSPDPE